MAYMLLAVGALMSVAGAYLGITGYHIVQIEEGWSTVIAGSTFFVGGFLMMALGLVLRSLLSLQATFVQAAFVTPAVSADAVTLPMPPSSPVVTAPSSKIEPQVEDQLKPDRVKRTPPPLVLAPAELEPAAPLPPKPPKLPPLPPKLSPELPVLATVPEPEQIPEPIPEPAPALAPVHAADDYKLETPSTPEHDLVVADRVVPPVHDPLPPAETTPSDDWLDRAFAEFDQGLPKATPPKVSPPKPAPAQISPPPFSPAPFSLPKAPPPPIKPPEPLREPAYADYNGVEAHGAEIPAPQTHGTEIHNAPVHTPEIDQPYLAEAPVEELPPPAPPRLTVPPLPPGPASAVIGRYESDGTSYVMYADGSIEAHSETGVFRFASMAELKAFIER